MKKKIASWSGIGMLSVILLTATFKPVYAQPAEPLKPFEQFIGEWKLDNALQVFEWGVGKTSVIGKSYRIGSDESRILVSEGMWVWHPGEKKIKGYITATDMPVVFFDYTTRFEDGKMVSELSSFDRTGKKSSYTEWMELQSDTTYKWTLIQNSDVIMNGVFTRK